MLSKNLSLLVKIEFFTHPHSFVRCNLDNKFPFFPVTHSELASLIPHRCLVPGVSKSNALEDKQRILPLPGLIQLI